MKWSLRNMIARKLNQAGLSPLHLAPQNDRTHAVLRLLKFDKGLVRVKWRDGLTPLHQFFKLERLIFCSSFSRSRHETAKRWEKELLSWPDIDGNMFWTLQLSETHLRYANQPRI
ncbi:hypothetical protein Gotri_004820 [Gossypium trilobum]|uniref:Uncharacterized protein n=1 Tax=Gossypium trilobum TaxID=34281 RepID=A0A7J9F635_9ROSI|nr:hypothetical protein [Gossypium trilobum]